MKLNNVVSLIVIGVLGAGLCICATYYNKAVSERNVLKEKIDNLYETYAFCDSLNRALWFYMEDWKEPTMFVCTLSVTNDRLIKKQIGVHSVYIVNRLRGK